MLLWPRLTETFYVIQLKCKIWKQPEKCSTVLINGWGISTVSNPNINTGAFSRNKNQAILIVYSNAFEMLLNIDWLELSQ